MYEDVLSGKWKQVSGTVRLLRGQLAHNYREVVLGQLRRTAGTLQERRGAVKRRLERGRRRLLAQAKY